MRKYLLKALVVSGALTIIAITLLILTSTTYIAVGSPPFESSDVITGIKAIKLSITQFGVWSFIQPHIIYSIGIFIFILAGILITLKWSESNA